MQSTNPVVEFYDSDYPSRALSKFPENFDAITHSQGIHDDVDRYREIAGEEPKQILELCCGTGRIGVPLAQDGHHVHGVDISREMLSTFQAHVESNELQEQVTLVECDIVDLGLPYRDFDICLIPFNSLLLIANFERQIEVIRRAIDHLRPGGELLLDIINPLRIPTAGETTPKPFFTRRHPINGNTYTRFAARSAFDALQRQTLFGWYDEITSSGLLRRQHYEILWRPIFRYELELMLRVCGIDCSAVEGGHRAESFTASSSRMFVRTRKK